MTDKSEGRGLRIAWLHNANDNYYTETQTWTSDFPLGRETLEKCYSRFIEIEAYEAVKAERDTAIQAMNDAHESLRKSGEIDRRLREENSRLQAENWIHKDAALRTYDGLAQKADKADELEKEVAALRAQVQKLEKSLERNLRYRVDE